MPNSEDDLESPGYEYLRSYQNMVGLHMKLLVLNYEREFCLAYKCPPIHRFYFSLPSSSPSEQRFLFTCLCAWLIRDKCHMNLEIEPEEYEDLDVILGVVIEALRLITSEDEQPSQGTNKRQDATSYLNQSRLRRGYGPEVIWALNILADRALEMMLEPGGDNAAAKDRLKIRVAYKQGPNQEKRRPSALNSITVGQPFVGGGLTTRPLGNYIIDDRSLLFSDNDDDDNDNGEVASVQREDPSDMRLRSGSAPDVEPREWYTRVESSRHILESVRFDESQSARLEDWSDEIGQLGEVQKCVDSFLDKSRPIFESSARLIDSQLQLIEGREKYLQAQLRGKLGSFLDIWRKYYAELARNKELLARVDSKTDKFESLDNRLQAVHGRIEARKRDLHDGSKLDELQTMIERLNAENKEYDTRIGLLLAVYFKLDS